MDPRSTRTYAPPAPPPSTTAASARARISGTARLPRSLSSPSAWSVLSEAAARRGHSDHDMRRKRPPALSFVLRMATARRLARVATLLVLDFAGVSLAIFTALMIKAVAFDHVNVSAAVHETERILAFAYLLTALLFARSGLYAGRGQRPGLSRIVGSLFQVAAVALVFAVVNGEHFRSYYLFYGSLAFALLYVSLLRAAYQWVTGRLLRAAGYRCRAVLVGTGDHIGDVAPALSDAPHARVEVVGFLSPHELPANGLRALGSLSDLDRVLAAEHVDEVIIADPVFP